LGLAVAPYALGEPTGLPIASHCHDHKDQEKARKKKKKKKDQVQSERPVQLSIRTYIKWDGECRARHPSVP
jgi:hypothetical protein